MTIDSNVFDTAARIIEKRGHAKHTSIGPDGGVCISMGLCVAGSGEHHSDYMNSIACYLGLEDPTLVVVWNDDDDTTEQNVVDTLRALAKEYA